MPIRSLVAGWAGFIGSHLCRRLLDRGDEVVCLDNLSTGHRRNVAELCERPGFSLVVGDVLAPPPLPGPVDRIYHLASPASPRAYQRLPVETLRANSEGTLRLLELAADRGARLLFASTSEVYGDPLQHPQAESYAGNVNPVGPRSMYDEAKRFGEALSVAVAAARGVDVRIARIFNTYGPHMEPGDGRVVSNLIVQALRGEPLTVYGDGSQTRSFQYVDDLVDGLIALMESGYTQPLNLGNPREHTILELAHLVQVMTGSVADIVHEPLPEDDPRQRCPDITLAGEMLGWRPIVPIEEGLMRTVAYLRSRITADGRWTH